MQNETLTTPILFLVFNRPDSTRTVFEAIRKARPKSLFIAADGARSHVPDDIGKCAAVREVVSNVDWPCEVKTLFRDNNLGCGRGISGAISWFFEHVEEGIILEDDTLPSPSFFTFCTTMLEHYRDDSRIMEIGGTMLPSRLADKSEYSYYFSNWDHIWGWATWRRAWKVFDYSMKHYPEAMRAKYFEGNYTSLYEHYYMDYMFEQSHIKNKDVTWWSVQWGFSRKINSGLVVVPLKNMVINLGLGEDATNTNNASQWSFMKLEEMEFPIRHPEIIMHDRVTDNEVFRRYFTTRRTRIKAFIKNICPKKVYNFAKAIVNRSFSLSVVLVDECVPALASYVL